MALLEGISKSLGTEHKSLSMEDQKKDLEDELKFKNSQLHNSESTQNRLEAELEKRQGELEKIETLDEKISGELMQLESKIAQYNHDIATKFDLIEDMRAQKLEQISMLHARKAVLASRAENFQSQISFLKLRGESKKQQLQEDSIESGLQSQELKLQQYQQNAFHLRHFIDTKQAESSYAEQMNSCLDMSDQINQILQQGRLPSVTH